MVTSAFITQVRKEVGDVPVLHQDRITGDGASTVYETKYKPLLEDSMVLRINNVAKTEGAASDYTLDDDTGVINLTTSHTSGMEARYKAVNFTDQQWIDAIGDTIDEMGDQFFKTVIRSPSGITLSANVQVYPCPSGCIEVLELLTSSSYSLSGTFEKPFVNHRYDRRANKLVLGDAPSRANYVQLSYLRKVARPLTKASVLDLEDAWIQMVKAGAKAKYFQTVANRIAQQGNVNTEDGTLKANQLRANASDHDKKFEFLRRRVKPIRPARINEFNIAESGPVA